ncbi:MAG: OmpA family protein [Alphaproteobacteria bacterium]|jgi:chemotaxis protein MotB
MNRWKLAAVVVALMPGYGITGPTTSAAIAQTAEDPARYRAEFFGKLSQALAGQRDVQIVGDRFVIQSEVLFQSGAAVIQPGGEKLLAIVARQLVEFSARIPKSANWVLQVEGHTDSTPISNSLYPSNWELSSARAIAVVKYLNSIGVPNERLVAASYSQYQPLSSIDRARNRRIELKFTNR